MTLLSTEFIAAREEGEQHVTALERAYLAAIRATGREAAQRFSERATVLHAAANWQPPDVGDVMAFAVSGDRIRANQRQMMGAISGRLTEIAGITFDALAPPAKRQLEKLGRRAAAISADLRTPVANAIAQAWAEGRSVVQTVRMIEAAVNGIAPARATMLARTDLISLSNGANANVVGILNDAAREAGEDPPINSKTWLSSQDGRVRPTHQDADGQTVPVDQPYNVGGYDIAYPGDPDGPDEEVINCRCTELYSEESATSASTGEIPEEAEAPTEMAAGGSVIPAIPLYVTPTKEETMSAVETEAPAAVRWISDVAFEGVSTGDGRYMAPGSLGWRDLPLTLMAMIETPDFGGHAGAQVAGRMDTLDKDEEHYMTGDPLPEGVTAIRSTGVFDAEGERGGETQRMVTDETMRGISMDLAVIEWALRDPETGEMIDPETATDEEWERAFMGELEFAVIQGEIMAATVCPTPAFAEARIAILAAAKVRPNVWKANAYAAFMLGVEEGQMMTTLTASVEVVRDSKLTDRFDWNSRDGVVASVRHAQARKDVAPLAPPVAWLHRPEPKEPTPFTILDSGECYGHLALWDTCHTGYLNGEFAQCVRAPHSITSYGQFHVGELRCDGGELLPIGKITYDTGHADLSRTRAAARCHYDDTGAVGAFVRARDGEFGIWVSGALRSDLTPEGVRDVRANPLSGDWRDFERNLELIAALAVPVPGFPIARSQLALAASADGDVRITALILTGLGLTAGVAPLHANGNPLHEGAALDAIIAGGADGLAELIG